MPQELIDIYNSVSEAKREKIFRYAIYVKNEIECGEDSENAMGGTSAAIARSSRKAEIVEKARKSLAACQSAAASAGLSEITMDEINAEIDELRMGR